MKTSMFCFVVLFAAFATPAVAQQADTPASVDISPKPFTNVIPNRTMWTITIRPSRAEAPQSADSDPNDILAALVKKFAGTVIVKIEVAYASGVRREIIRYADESEMTRYSTDSFTIYLDRATGEPVFDDSAGAMRWEELAWVSDKYYEESVSYEGRLCDVYRQYNRQATDGEIPENFVSGLSRSELPAGTEAIPIATAYIDRETRFPVAQSTTNEIRIYKQVAPFVPFTLPPELKNAIQRRAEALQERQQRFDIGR